MIACRVAGVGRRPPSRWHGRMSLEPTKRASSRSLRCSVECMSASTYLHRHVPSSWLHLNRAGGHGSRSRMHTHMQCSVTCGCGSTPFSPRRAMNRNTKPQRPAYWAIVLYRRISSGTMQASRLWRLGASTYITHFGMPSTVPSPPNLPSSGWGRGRGCVVGA